MYCSKMILDFCGDHLQWYRIWKSVKSGKLVIVGIWSCTEVHKIMENAKYTNIISGFYCIMKHFICYLAFSCARSSSPITTTASTTKGGSSAETCNPSYRSCKSPATPISSTTTSATELTRFQTHGEKSVHSVLLCDCLSEPLWNMETTR